MIIHFWKCIPHLYPFWPACISEILIISTIISSMDSFHHIMAKTILGTWLPIAIRQIERRTTRMARPAITPTIMAIDFPTWSSLEESAQNTMLEKKQWSELVLYYILCIKIWKDNEEGCYNPAWVRKESRNSWLKKYFCSIISDAGWYYNRWALLL